jgi:serine/threonine protein phosphatase PrpC
MLSKVPIYLFFDGLGNGYFPPYMTATPEINIEYRTPQDEFLVVATDGLWGYCYDEDILEIMDKCTTRNPAPLLALRAFRHAIDKGDLVSTDDVNIIKLLNASPRLRRQYIDDTTIIVIPLKNTKKG